MASGTLGGPGLLARYPGTLSGGGRARPCFVVVAVAVAVAAVVLVVVSLLFVCFAAVAVFSAVAFFPPCYILHLLHPLWITTSFVKRFLR